MSVNPALSAPGGEPRPYDGETFVLSEPNITFQVESGGGYPGAGGTYYAKGNLFLSAQRVVFVNRDPNSNFKAFNLPLHAMSKEKLSKGGMISNAKITGKIAPQTNGGLSGMGTFKMVFKGSGAEQFMSHMRGFLEQARSQAPEQRRAAAERQQMQHQNQIAAQTGGPAYGAYPNYPAPYSQGPPSAAGGYGGPYGGGAMPAQPPPYTAGGAGGAPPPGNGGESRPPGVVQVQHAYVDPDNPDVIYLEKKSEPSRDLSGPPSQYAAGSQQQRPPPTHGQAPATGGYPYGGPQGQQGQQQQQQQQQGHYIQQYAPGYNPNAPQSNQR
eukprot:TRINITY_DN1144_c0_g1_i1.p1 TRINITY_DN1144_c0_g1~~TRINITY_DN1144_c0_g1_i1.p1  ORF type:complete len:326 (+),score=37.17 TRINITY_DN1144_c0_g1_i1:291-1268(+)